MKKLFITLIFVFAILFSLTMANAAAEMSYSNGTVTISGMEGEGVLVRTSYDGDGALQSADTYKVHNGENPVKANAGDRLFLWKGLDSLEPVCERLIVEETDGNNVLIVFFSRAGENWQVGNVDKGNTAVIEEYIESSIDADVFEIKATDPYPESYNETLTRVNRERDNDERPGFEGRIENIDKYDTVFLGYPIWYGGLPMIMYTFLEEYDMGSKTIIPFSTHGGSGWGSTKGELKKLCPDAKLADGYSIAGTEAREESTKNAVEKWLEGLDMPKKNNDEAAVLAAYNIIQQAMVDADIDTLRRVIKDDKTFTHMSGKVQTKEEYLADIESGALDYKAYTIENAQVETDGNYAKLTARTTLTANAYGANGSWPFNTTAWFERINGEWIYCNSPK